MTMDKSNKFERFQRAFEKGQKGKVDSFEVWLQDKGFESERVHYESLTNYFRENPELTPNHQGELEKVAEFIGYCFNRKDRIYHIPIVGVEGVGKTQFLVTIKSFLEKSMESGFKLYNSGEFGEVEEEPKLFGFLEQIREEGPEVVLIDSCESDKMVEKSLEKISEAMGIGVLITAWSPEVWYYRKARVEEVAETTNEIFLYPLSREEDKDLLGLAWRYMGNKDIPDEVLDEIHDYSAGIPKLSLKMSLISLKEWFMKKTDTLEKAHIESSADKMGIRDVEEKLESLSGAGGVIIKNILIADGEGVHPSALVELLEKSKSTISYHLQALRREGFLTSTRVGKFASYRVKENMVPFIQLKIMREGEFDV